MDLEDFKTVYSRGAYLLSDTDDQEMDRACSVNHHFRVIISVIYTCSSGRKVLIQADGFRHLQVPLLGDSGGGV